MHRGLRRGSSVRQALSHGSYPDHDMSFQTRRHTMFACDQSKTRGLRSELALPEDFYNVLARDMEPLYLLAFLLTTNHQTAEKCFLASVEGPLEHLTVFKDWAGAWVKHSLIKKAVRMVFADPARGERKRQPWRSEQDGRRLASIDDVTELPDLQRFVFVLTFLEGYSTRNCSALLNTATESVLEAKTAALLQLSW